MVLKVPVQDQVFWACDKTEYHEGNVWLSKVTYLMAKKLKRGRTGVGKGGAGWGLVKNKGV